MVEISELQQQLIQLQEQLTREKDEKSQALSKAELLQSELENAKESERKMLDSLTSQTKQLEQTKISLEEAKLEVKSLTELSLIRTSDVVKKLRTELKLAVEAEDKSKKAMDDLAIALKEVTTESNRAKKSYFQTQSELARLKSEAEESSTAWREKESGFINCIKISEEENERLIESQRTAREEISKLRDIVRHAVKEANAVKEALEIARNENSQLKDLVSCKENALKSIRQEYECLKVSEAAAMDSVKELSGLIAAAAAAADSGSFDGEGGGKQLEKLPSENWRSARMEGSVFDLFRPSPPDQKEKENFEGEMSPSRQKRKRQILRRFGDVLRMRTFHK